MWGYVLLVGLAFIVLYLTLRERMGSVLAIAGGLGAIVAIGTMVFQSVMIGSIAAAATVLLVGATAMVVRALRKRRAQRTADNPGAAGSIDPTFLNGWLNGHQGFRLLWLGFLVFGTTILRKPYINYQLLLGMAVLLFSLIRSELAYRLRRRGCFPTKRVLFDLIPWRTARPYTSSQNLGIVNQYPLEPFVWDFLTFALILWATGGIGSPFLPLLVFAGSIATFALYSTTGRRSPLGIMLAALLLGSVLPVSSLSTTPVAASGFGVFGLDFKVNGMRVAPGFVLDDSGSGAAWPITSPAVTLMFALVTNSVFLWFSSQMSSKAAEKYNQVLHGDKRQQLGDGVS